MNVLIVEDEVDSAEVLQFVLEAEGHTVGLASNGREVVHKPFDLDVLLGLLRRVIETPGGFDFTGADCQKWMKEVGFKQTRVEHLAGPDSMVVGIK